MKIALVTLMFAVTASQAYAINRHNIASKSCSEVHAIIAREGAAILRYPSKRKNGLPLYERYVANGRFCEGNKIAKYTTVPTRDNSTCPVYYCRDYSSSQ